MEHNCTNCHYGQMEYSQDNARCFDGCFCFENPMHPNWTPYTNADAIRSMTDAQLAHFLARNYGGSVGQYLNWLKAVNVIEIEGDGK